MHIKFSLHGGAPLRRATLCAILMLATTPLGAQQQKQPQAPLPVQTDVAVALVLAVDASGSVSNDRFELQKQGYAAAFRNRQVLNSIRSLGAARSCAPIAAASTVQMRSD